MKAYLTRQDVMEILYDNDKMSRDFEGPPIWELPPHAQDDRVDEYIKNNLKEYVADDGDAIYIG